METNKLPLIGRERALMNALTKQIHNRGMAGYSVGRVRETPRGCAFDVQIVTNERGHYIPTGHYARVEVTLDRFDADEANARVHNKTTPASGNAR